jgi:hypothetical protein
MGDLLDKYNKASALGGDKARLAKVKVMTPLINGLKKYKVALGPLKKPALLKLVEDMLDESEKEVAIMARLANPVINTRETLNKTINNARAVVTSGDEVAYGKVWNTNVRGVGTTLAVLAKLDPRVKTIHTEWLPYTSGHWAAAGKNVAEGVTDPTERKQKIKEAAQKLLTAAEAVDAEMKRRKFWT